MNDISKFRLSNVADSCSIWNLLASQILRSAAARARISICCTEFVRYECLHKPGRVRPERTRLQGRLLREIESGQIYCCNIELEDLQELDILSKRKKVSKGELASMIFARRIVQAFMTDDIKAAKLARTIMAADFVQSTTQLLGWLYFHGMLQDSDKDKIESELTEFGRNLQPHLDDAYREALRCRLMASSSENSVRAE